MDHYKKTKSIQGIEEKMRGLEQSSLRYQALKDAKDFKSSWIGLGRCLYTVYKEKAYREWGYQAFDSYLSMEIGIKKQTALKLLRSYYFLEQEEPDYLRQDYLESQKAALLAGWESVDVLRAAKNKKGISGQDYQNFKKDIFEKGKDAGQMKKELTALIRQRQEPDPAEAREKRRITTLKRFLSNLKALKSEMETANLLSLPLIRQAETLIKKIEAEIS